MEKTINNIYRRKDGRWKAQYVVSYDAKGKAKCKYIYGKNYSDVKNKLLKNQDKSYVILTKNIDGNKPYELWLDKWLNAKKNSIKDSSYIRYNNIIKNHIKPELGKQPINKISTSLIEKFVSHKLSNGRLDGNGGLSVKTMLDILLIIKESFAFAQRFGVHTICCIDRISLRKSHHEMRVLSVFEQERLISVLLNDIDKFKLGVFICLFTGIRIGELCALQWKDISFKDKTLKVRNTLQRLQYENPNDLCKTRIIVTEPKSKFSLRTIPLPDFVIERMHPFIGDQNAYILSGECKSVIEPRTMQNRFKTYLKQGEIEDANFHSLRHTFATRCVETGFDVKTLSDILGHSSVKVTLDRYVHSSMLLKRKNMDKLSLFY